VLNLSKIQFKSNSQLLLNLTDALIGCAQSLKDTIQKQFTTEAALLIRFAPLCSISQRYNSKAIHNRFAFYHFSELVVLNLSKIQFKSNSQHSDANKNQEKSCAQSLKDTIQKQFTTTMRIITDIQALCSISQRYNSKAIHNWYG